MMDRINKKQSKIVNIHFAIMELNNRLNTGRSAMQRIGSIIIIMLAIFSFPEHGRADPADIAGAWSGGGWVDFASGNRERARCRARFSQRSESSYVLSATCATASGSVSQTAMIRRTGSNSYSGSFYNKEYDVSGTINITVHGNSQNVRLSSGSGSAVLTLSR